MKGSLLFRVQTASCSVTGRCTNPVTAMSALCQWFCTCRCIGKRNKDFLNANAKAPFCRNNMATSGVGGKGGGGGGGENITNQPLTKGLGQLLAKPTYTCDICGEEGLNEDDMRTHVLLEHIEGAISCPFCDLEGTTAEEMTIHVNTQHLDFSSPHSDDDVYQKTEDIMKVINEEESDTKVNSAIQNQENKTNNENETAQDKLNNASLSNSSQKLNFLNVQKQDGGTESTSASKPVGSNNKESIESYMPLQELRNASEVSMDTVSSCQSNHSSSTSSSPESEISLGNRESSSGNNSSSSYEASSSYSSTPEETDCGQPGQQQVHPRDITINVIKDSPKKTASNADEAELKMGSVDGEEQSRKRAKLYLHVPQPHSPRRQINAESGAAASRGVSYLLDSHASTAQLHRFVQLAAPR